MSLRTEYDAWHQRIYESDPEHDDASSPWYDLVRKTIGPVVGLQILEVACGRGGFVRELARAGASVAGCDFSFSALRVGKSKLGGNGLKKVGDRLVQGDAQKLPFADASFDVVISCETIEHLPDAQSALNEMHRVARPGGRLFLTTPNYLNFMGLYEIYAILRHPRRKDDQPFDRRQWFPQIRRCIRRAGWVISYSDGTVHQFPFIPGRNPLTFPKLEAHHTLRRLLSPFAYHYFVIARKPSAT
ncbi:MAG TPA: class I SAM-dependent methyltransferase [Candidatus Acidoferrum sp.]|nr:class I SAM-dependent methyltransferase [Candidatus Acidoferrum sp.]